MEVVLWEARGERREARGRISKVREKSLRGFFLGVLGYLSISGKSMPCPYNLSLTNRPKQSVGGKGHQAFGVGVVHLNKLRIGIGVDLIKGSST